jgi:hypothetical protein
MLGFPHACYRELGGAVSCPDPMFGADAPGATWQMTFLHAALGRTPASFVGVPPDSPFFSKGTGINSPKPPKAPKHGGGGSGGGGGGGHGHHGGPPVPAPTTGPPGGH